MCGGGNGEETEEGGRAARDKVKRGPAEFLECAAGSVQRGVCGL